MSVVCDKGKGRPLGELKATFIRALKVLQCSKTIMRYDRSQCFLLALCVCALGRGLTEMVRGLGQRRGGGVPATPFGGGWGPPPPPTAPQTVEHPSGSHIGWRRPPWFFHDQCFAPAVRCALDLLTMCMVCCWHIPVTVQQFSRSPLHYLLCSLSSGSVPLSIYLPPVLFSRLTF